MNIGERIKSLRENRNLTQEQVGDFLGVNKATVQRYECGIIDIKRTTAIKLAEILGTTPSYIMGWEDVPLSRFPEAEGDFPDISQIKNPDIRMFARGASRLPQADAETLRKVAQAMFPEAFKDENDPT